LLNIGLMPLLLTIAALGVVLPLPDIEPLLALTPGVLKLLPRIPCARPVGTDRIRGRGVRETCEPLRG